MLKRLLSFRHGPVLELGMPLLTATPQQTRLQHGGTTHENSAGMGRVHDLQCTRMRVF